MLSYLVTIKCIDSTLLSQCLLISFTYGGDMLRNYSWTLIQIFTSHCLKQYSFPGLAAFTKYYVKQLSEPIKHLVYNKSLHKIISIDNKIYYAVQRQRNMLMMEKDGIKVITLIFFLILQSFLGVQNINKSVFVLSLPQ